ncbi:bifunctional chorismate mutase/prephenate dehydratase [Ruminococcus sp. FC2018]|uniref:bifunctional chorismate mutase/prephenate dehydratase n=1 Tax=Ruminococcus sp. FC2018 TaxID=1410617 RepID=UPI00048C4F92|nr:bifunctional chorismate mutase/prephenate dehydratase [Ruminococcus sp. FC2018]
MELEELRKKINVTDDRIAELFIERMKLCKDVSEYKIKNDLPVFQKGREEQILQRMKDMFPEELKNSSQVLYQTIMDISKCLQYQDFFSDKNSIESEYVDLNAKCKAAVPGTEGSFSQMACKKLLPNGEITFFNGFEQVFEAVDDKRFDFGVVPIANSTAGSVTATYELLKKYDLKICAGTKLRISHCLAARQDTDPEDIQIVYSHEQALMQCSEFILHHGYKGHNYANTALAAQFVAQSDRPVAAICSRECALNNGLKILADDIANASENYTRFIVISKKTLCTEKADVISVSLSLPHERSALYRLLTKFSVAGLNLTMIESRPLANTDFEAVFYLDFQGSIKDPKVAMLINQLEDELGYFKFLGNYEFITEVQK